MREWRRKNPERNAALIAASKAKDPERYKRVKVSARLLKVYGITLEQYDAMVAAQKGLCGICGKPELRGDHRLAVDHCHESGNVRGLLCRACNQALGTFGDTIAGLKLVMAYLEKAGGLCSR